MEKQYEKVEVALEKEVLEKLKDLAKEYETDIEEVINTLLSGVFKEIYDEEV